MTEHNRKSRSIYLPNSTNVTSVLTARCS